MRRVGVRVLPALLLVAAGSAGGCAAADRDGEARGEGRGAGSDVAVGETLRYECDGGGIVRASYPTDSTAVLEHDGRSLSLRRAESASGARYVGGGVEWWTRGRGVGAEGTLSRIADPAEAGMGELEPLETCRESSATEPGSAPQA